MRSLILLVPLFALLLSCNKNDVNGGPEQRVYYQPGEFIMGADLSYVNEILDHGGVYTDSGEVSDPYKIFSEYGSNVVRLRLFHTPRWTAELYDGDKMYHDIEDLRLGIQRAVDNNMQVLLDFHYSDNWADPSTQVPPQAWQGLEPDVLGDSIYNYTFNTLKKLEDAGLMPAYVQVGNEINPGFVLPHGDRWNKTSQFIDLINRAVNGVRDAAAGSSTPVKVLLHIAQPENAMAWLEGLADQGLADYDFIGLSYYYQWSDVPPDDLNLYLEELKSEYGKDILILETAYPWTLENADSYPNIIDVDELEPHYPATEAGQFKYLKKLVQEIMEGGGKGIFYWEPAWISADIKTQWGTGSAWDCNALFDFGGEVLQGMDYMTWDYGSVK